MMDLWIWFLAAVVGTVALIIEAVNYGRSTFEMPLYIAATALTVFAVIAGFFVWYGRVLLRKPTTMYYVLAIYGFATALATLIMVGLQGHLAFESTVATVLPEFEKQVENDLIALVSQYLGGVGSSSGR